MNDGFFVEPREKDQIHPHFYRAGSNQTQPLADQLRLDHRFDWD